MIKAVSISNISHAADESEMKLFDWENKVRKINEAYEIVKGHLDGTFYSTNKIRKTLGVDTIGRFFILFFISFFFNYFF